MDGRLGGRVIGGRAGLNGSWRLFNFSGRQLKHPDEYEGPEYFKAHGKNLGTAMVLAQK